MGNIIPKMIVSGYKCTGAGKAIRYAFNNGLLTYTIMAEGWKKRQKKMKREDVQKFIDSKV